MKQLKQRTVFVLIFALLLAAGTVIFCIMYVSSGREWSSSPVNQSSYTSGKLSSGVLCDRNGVILYDAQTQRFAESALLRKATLHAVGDNGGNIITGGRELFAPLMVGYNPITGTTLGGNTVFLCVDSRLNETAYQALDGRNGTVALYNYRTGEVLCMVSASTYDPADPDETAAVAEGSPGYEGAYLNRFLSATYTPGSVFKVVTAAAALEQLPDIQNYTFECTGSYSIGGDAVTCTRAHATVDLSSALTLSCNGAFADLALQLGGDTLEEYARGAGLLDRLEVSGVLSAQGRFDPAAEGSLDLGWSGAGQSTDLVCPANMMALMGCIAGEGSAAAPRLVSRVRSPLGLPVSFSAGETLSLDWETETCRLLKEMMRNNVTENYGQEQFGTLPVCAKSGTAEVGGGAEPHAWFAGFVDSEDTPYAFVVLVENGGWGSSEAGAIAAAVLSAAVGEE